MALLGAGGTTLSLIAAKISWANLQHKPTIWDLFQVTLHNLSCLVFGLAVSRFSAGR